MIDNYDKAKDILEKNNQIHLLSHYTNLTEQKKQELIGQILDIDFVQINELYQRLKEDTNLPKEVVEPISYIDKSKLSDEDRNRYEKQGRQAIKEKKFAVVTMAGGQGTRLGYNGPKGTFMLGINPDKSLFEIFCDELKKAKQKYDVTIPWYIMTSKENNSETIRFFENNNFFDYSKEAIKFFIQGELPMITQEGKILVSEEGIVKMASDGHGGIFEALFKNNVVDDMEKRKIEWIFIGPVDNPLVNMVDEILVGLAIDKKVLAAGKSLVKANPEEKVGVFCKKNGKPSVIEYTEITHEMANAKNQDNELIYGESHINCNLFNIQGIRKIGDEKLPYHVALKKAKYMNENGDIIEPSEPNSYKFESFIFDAFSKIDDMAILRVKREEEFAPIKNKTGVDSVETARKLYVNKFKKN